MTLGHDFIQDKFLFFSIAVSVAVVFVVAGFVTLLLFQFLLHLLLFIYFLTFRGFISYIIHFIMLVVYGDYVMLSLMSAILVLRSLQLRLALFCLFFTLFSYLLTVSVLNFPNSTIVRPKIVICVWSYILKKIRLGR